MNLDLEQTPAGKPVIVTVLASYLAVQGVLASFYYALLLSGGVLMLVFGDGGSTSRLVWTLYALVGVCASGALLYACLHIPRRNKKALKMAIFGQLVLLCSLVAGTEILAITAVVASLLLTRPAVRRYMSEAPETGISTPVHPAL